MIPPTEAPAASWKSVSGTFAVTTWVLREKKEAAGLGGKMLIVETPIVLVFVEGKKDIRAVDVPELIVEKKGGLMVVSKRYPPTPALMVETIRIVLSRLPRLKPLCVAAVGS